METNGIIGMLGLILNYLNRKSPWKIILGLSCFYTFQFSFLCLSVLSFLRQNNISKEQMEEDLNTELDLSGSYDWRMSETEKIKHYMKKAED